MKFDAETKTLSFASNEEVREFHAELSELIRLSMVVATHQIPDPQEAKAVSQRRMRELRALMSALNTIRKTLPRKDFG